MITRSLVNNAFSVLHYVIKVTLHYLIRYIASGFIPLGTFAHSFITEADRQALRASEGIGEEGERKRK